MFCVFGPYPGNCSKLTELVGRVKSERLHNSDPTIHFKAESSVNDMLRCLQQVESRSRIRVVFTGTKVTVVYCIHSAKGF